MTRQQANESADQVLETFCCTPHMKTAVADAILAAWKQGAEEMRERAAAKAGEMFRCGLEDDVEHEIESLKVTE